MKSDFTKKEICVIFNIVLKDLEKYIKDNSIKSFQKKKNQGHGFSYTYNIVDLSKDTIFIDLVNNTPNSNKDIDALLHEYIYQLDRKGKTQEELKVINKLTKKTNSFLHKECRYLLNPQKRQQEIDLAIKNKKDKEEKEIILNNLSENYEELFKFELFSEERKNIEYILHVGDTNSGKTYHAIKQLKETGGVYLAPLRLHGKYMKK